MSYGIGACNVFMKVIGLGRSQRQQIFIDAYDGIGTEKRLDVDKIVNYCGIYMQCNNKMMIAVKRQPLWYRYAVIGFGGLIAVGALVYITKAYLRPSTPEMKALIKDAARKELQKILKLPRSLKI
jgi:hypothetical protein